MSNNIATLKSWSITVIEMVPFDTLDMVSYLYAIVTLSLSRTVFEIFDLKNAVTLIGLAV